MELSERKQKILAAVVEHYILTGEPIGSKVLSQNLSFPGGIPVLRRPVNAAASIKPAGAQEDFRYDS